VEALLHDAGHLAGGGWRLRRGAWRAALAGAATLPQLALLLHELAEACGRDKGRMRLQRDAFQRVGRNLATTGPPEHRLAAPPFLPQVLEHVVLTRAGALLAYRRLAQEIGAPPPPPYGAADDDEAASAAAAAAERFGVPPLPAGLPPTLKCRVEFAGYRKGDPAAASPAARLPAAWYLLAPVMAVAPTAAGAPRDRGAGVTTVGRCRLTLSNPR